MTKEKRAKLKAKLKLLNDQIDVLTNDWMDIEEELEHLHQQRVSVQTKLDAKPKRKKK